MDYKEQLKDKRWKILSEKVKDYYDFTCCGCGNNKDLHVHHKRYYKNRMAWEYEISDLVCLCSSCHLTFHENLEKFNKIITDYRLYYSYEFEQILKVVELMCKIDTSYYLKIIAHLEALTKYSF